MPKARDHIWTEINTHWTCVFPTGHEPDPAILRDCRKEMPNFVLLWCVKEYTRPGKPDPVTYGYHVIGSWEPYPKDDGREPLIVDARPSNFPFTGGYIYEERTWALNWPEKTPQYRERQPPVPLNVDDELVAFVRCYYHSYRNTAPSERKRKVGSMLEFRWERAEQAMDSLQETHDKDFWGARNLWSKAIEEGNFLDPPKPHTPTPFVYTGEI